MIFLRQVTADAVLISHPHFDHDGGEYRSGRLAWAGKVPVLRWPGRWELGEDTTIHGFKGYHAGSLWPRIWPDLTPFGESK